MHELSAFSCLSSSPFYTLFYPSSHTCTTIQYTTCLPSFCPRLLLSRSLIYPSTQNILPYTSCHLFLSTLLTLLTPTTPTPQPQCTHNQTTHLYPPSFIHPFPPPSTTNPLQTPSTSPPGTNPSSSSSSASTPPSPSSGPPASAPSSPK